MTIPQSWTPPQTSSVYSDNNRHTQTDSNGTTKIWQAQRHTETTCESSITLGMHWGLLKYYEKDGNGDNDSENRIADMGSWTHTQVTGCTVTLSCICCILQLLVYHTHLYVIQLWSYIPRCFWPATLISNQQHGLRQQEVNCHLFWQLLPLTANNFMSYERYKWK